MSLPTTSQAQRGPGRPARGVLRATVPSYGVLSAVERDNLYCCGAQGWIFTSPWVVTPSTARYPAVLLLTASGAPVTLAVDGRVARHGAAAIAPLTRRGLWAMDVGLVSVQIEARHPAFRAFRRIARPGVCGLERGAFARFDRDLARAYEGRLTLVEARRLFEGLVETAVAQIPAPGRRDARAEHLRAFLHEHPDCSLRDLARTLDVSYTTASEVFADAMGLPLRAYLAGRKCRRASSGLVYAEVRLTDLAHASGFTDSSHLTRTWQRSYGHPPSYVRDPRHVRVFV